MRVARELLSQHSDFALDGVTGALRLDPQNDRRIERSPVLAEYRKGAVVPLVRP